MTTLAIVGAGGVLGAKLVEEALRRSDVDRVHAYMHGAIPAIPAAASERVSWEPLELGDGVAVADALQRAHPDAVINAAAMTNVDACETRRAEAFAANAAGPHHLAETCARLSIHLLHVSTDYVFPGDAQQPGPYDEEAPPRPINYYGWTKLEGERAIQRTCMGRVPWLVARTALVYGVLPGGRPNFISWLIAELRAGKRVKVVYDQYNTPTLGDDLAAALVHLMRTGSEGIIHLAGADVLSREAWARAIAAYYGLDTGLIDVVSTAELGQRAPRPLQSGLRTRRQDELGDVRLRGVHAGFEALGLS